ncbi:MAG TPA: ATP-dependent RecD-like DNA helicase [Clostridia bacterium]|nr:ATP-dependent RecD-like DNA helicase [Clostridia bacterium]
MVTIDGVVERITYYNEENMYGVIRIKVEGKEDLTTAVGTFPPLYEGQSIRVSGRWRNHSNYGWQLQVEKIEELVPATLVAIQRYLASGLIKGVGPKTAEKLVAHFGLKTLDVIEYTPDKLVEVEGIGRVKAERIGKAFQDQKEIKQVMLALQGYGISPSYAIKIYRQYGRDSLTVIRQNPYRLAEDIFGIGFLTADRIARQVGIEPTSPFRVQSAVKYFLAEEANNGHVYLPQEKLAEILKEKLEVDEGIIKESLRILEEKKEIFRDVFADHTAVYLAPFYYAERGVAELFSSLAAIPLQADLADWADQLKIWEEENGIILAEKQREAVEIALTSNLTILTGGPGTGKTTTIRAIIGLLELAGYRVVLAAPTGRAAKRMAETTGREAKTVHRLLEYGYAEGEGMEFKRNRDNPIDADVLIVDETSMLDLLLTYNLLKALAPGTRLILVGDTDQLPSVGAGNVLKDLISSGIASVVRLNEIFRQAQESMIVVNAHRINQGDFPLLNKQDFFFLEVSEPEQIVQTVIELCSSRLPNYYKLDPLNDIQVLTPQRRTQTGVENLNLKLQEVLNPKGIGKKELKFGDKVYRTGDRVIQLKNNYDKLVFNGDIGRIVWIDLEEKLVGVVFNDLEGDREVIYEQDELDELSLAYAISVHKSQGSEYPAVVMPVSFQHYNMLQRNLLYTAITRAKQLVVLVGSRRALGAALRNNQVVLRYSKLRERLEEGFHARRLIHLLRENH